MISESAVTSVGIPAGDRHWFLIFTKPRQEALALANLERQGYSAFLPRLRLRRRRKGQLTTLVEPLFPRYLFAHLSVTCDNWKPISSTLGVSNIVRFGLEPARVPDELVAALLEQGDDLGIRDAPEKNLLPGERVRVGSGVFEGLEGVFEAKTGRERVTLLLEVAGRVTRVELPEYDLDL